MQKETENKKNDEHNHELEVEEESEGVEDHEEEKSDEEEDESEGVVELDQSEGGVELDQSEGGQLEKSESEEGDESEVVDLELHYEDENILPVEKKSTKNKDDKSPLENYDHIKDPNVKMLLSMSIEDSSKDEVVKMLLKSKALENKENTSNKKKVGIYNMKSQYNIDNLKNDPIYKSISFNHHVNREDPEFTSDFSTAKKKLISKMTKEGEDRILVKILATDETTELDSLDKVHREYIDTKVKTYLYNKQRKLEAIQEKLNEEFIQKHTFSPETLTSSDRRNLEQFLSDQSNHNRKIQDKIKMAQEERDKKEQEAVQESPQVDSNSVRIFEEKIKTAEPTHIRLYNKGFKNKKEKLLNSGESKSVSAEKKVTKKHAEEYSNSLFKLAEEKKIKMEKIKSKIINEESESHSSKTSKSSNRVLLHFLMDKYKNKMDSLTSDDSPPSVPSRLNLEQVTEVLLGLGFIENRVDENKTSHQINESRLIAELYSSLKDEDGLVSFDGLFLFLLSIVNLYEYFLYSSYKRSHPVEGEQIKAEIMNLIAEDILAKTVRSSKYGAFGAEGNFLISLSKARMINKDFNIFYINFMNKGGHSNRKVVKENKNESRPTHKPCINENSKKLHSEYRNRISESSEMVNNKEVRILSYINNLIVKKEKKRNLNAQLKEVAENKKLEECTFQPKVNTDFISSKMGHEVDNRMDRWNRLHKLGMKIVSNKKDRNKEEIQEEKEKGECTFKPMLVSESINDSGRIKNDIFNESNYNLMYNRLKNGRIQRAIKESVHERGEFPTELIDYCKITNNVVKGNSKENFLNTTKNLSKNQGSPNSASPLKEAESEEKKDAIPLLIIDVNIRPGVKKKIYVFDGDTADGLADHFSKEHNLDADTKAKLQVLIGSHMSRLLMRIDEENQSISEKSSTYNLS